MALTADREVDHFVDQELRSFKVGGSETIYKGSYVSVDSSGYAAPLAAGEKFVGLAYAGIDNSAGSDGDKSVKVFTVGDFEVSLSGAAVTDIGRPVFASADGTVTFDGNGNSYVGIVEQFISSGVIMLRLDAQRRMVKTIVHAVDNLAAGADIAARAVHSFNHDAWIFSARVVNQATAASGIDNSNTCVVALVVGGSSLVSETFDSTTTFPAANTAQNLGTLSNNNAAAGDVLTLAITNGTTADPGPFLIEVDYV